MSADLLLSDVVSDRDLNKTEARGLVDSIRVDVADIGERIATAYKGRAWVALDYPSWDALCDAEFDGARLRIPREDRAEQVQSLRAAGLSTRAIGSALGVNHSTVVRDLGSTGASAPVEVQSLDGRTRPATQPPRPAAAPRPGAPTPEAPAAAAATALPAGAPDLTGVDRDTGEVLAPEEWAETPTEREAVGVQPAPPMHPLAAARAAVAAQPAMLAGKAFDRLHTARLLLTEAGPAAQIVADLVNDGLTDGDQGHDWLPELDALLPLLNDLAAALRRRNLRSVHG